MAFWQRNHLDVQVNEYSWHMGSDGRKLASTWLGFVSQYFVSSYYELDIDLSEQDRSMCVLWNWNSIIWQNHYWMSSRNGKRMDWNRKWGGERGGVKILQGPGKGLGRQSGRCLWRNVPFGVWKRVVVSNYLELGPQASSSKGNILITFLSRKTYLFLSSKSHQS
jgi:hypothetical protein